MQDYIIEIYSKFYSKIYGFEYYLNPTIRHKTIIKNFLIEAKKIQPVIGKDFIFEFITFQFKRYFNFNIKAMKKIQFNWIIGKKGLKYWIKKSENWLYWNRQFRYELKLVEVQPYQYNLSPYYKKLQKTLLYGSEQGFLNCVELNLYDKNTKECLLCKFKHDCQKISKK